MLAAGELDVVGKSKVGYYGINFELHSGQYLKGNTAMQNEAASKVSRDALKRYGILHLD